MPDFVSRLRPAQSVPAVLFTALAVGVSCSAAAQAPPPPRADVRLQGVVIDAETQQPVRAATVSVVGIEMSVTTGRWGAFELPDAPLGPVSIRVTAAGHPTVVQDVEVRSGRIAFVRVVLPSIAATLEELVVGVDRSPEATSEQAQSAADLLALEVPRTRANPGMVGDRDFQLRLRDGTTVSGNVEPLILIDGVAISADLAFEALENIPASDVEEIEVLKGPAASALYPNAANGVVRVTTKRGNVRR